MKPHQFQFTWMHYFVQGIPGLTVFIIKSKPIPHGINSGIHIHPDCNSWFLRGRFCYLNKHVQFIQMINMNKWSVFSGENQFFARFCRPIENNLFGINSAGNGLLIFKSRNYFGPRSFLMKDIANRRQVIGFVWPGKLHFRISGWKSFISFLISISDGFLGKYKKRRSVFFNKFSNSNSINVCGWR